MASKHSHCVNAAPEGDLESTSPHQTIKLSTVEPRFIKNPYTEYYGFFIEKSRNGRGTGKVIRVKHLPQQKFIKATLLVYSYTRTPPADGTYVVLQFIQSEKYLYRNENGELRLKEDGFHPESAVGITTAADPRVFLIKSGKHSRDFVIKWQGSADHTITLLPQSAKPVELQPIGVNGPSDGQLFKLELPILRAATESDSLVTAVDVPFPHPLTPSDANDQFGESQVELDD
ncbi:uncharacterized protein LOC144924845 [Branchiostoma floridae x Branchiostoma belcheri]